MLLIISILFIGAFACTVAGQGSAGGQLLVKAIDKNMNPVWQANITVNATGGTPQTMVANNSGMVIFTNLTPGEYTVAANHRGHMAFPTTANVSGSGVQNVTIGFPDYLAGAAPATPTPLATPSTSPTQVPSPTKTPGFEAAFAVVALAIVAIGIINKKD